MILQWLTKRNWFAEDQVAAGVVASVVVVVVFREGILSSKFWAAKGNGTVHLLVNTQPIQQSQSDLTVRLRKANADATPAAIAAIRRGSHCSGADSGESSGEGKSGHGDGFNAHGNCYDGGRFGSGLGWRSDDSAAAAAATVVTLCFFLLMGVD